MAKPYTQAGMVNIFVVPQLNAPILQLPRNNSLYVSVPENSMPTKDKNTTILRATFLVTQLNVDLS